jgi:Leucine-rich repeat (LRR) protein
MYYTDCKRLSEVQVIALRERNLAQGLDVLSSCPQLQIAYLQSNRFTDLVHLSKMTKLVKLNLSNNSITSLPSKEILSGLKSLRILFLDNNQMQKWKNLENLTGISSLYHLTLLNNPVVQTAGYRHFMVTKMPGLLALDDFIITDEERMEDVGHGVRFKALSQFMRLFAPEFKEGLTAEQHLFQVDLEIYKLRRLYEKNSPSIRIQALFKGYKRRVAHTNYFQKKLKSIIYIQKMVRGWLQRLRVKRELR